MLKFHDCCLCVTKSNCAFIFDGSCCWSENIKKNNKSSLVAKGSNAKLPRVARRDAQYSAREPLSWVVKTQLAIEIWALSKDIAGKSAAVTD